MRWTGYVACIGQVRNAYKIVFGKGDLGVYIKIILEWILKKYTVRMWTEFSWLMTETTGGMR
jgi:hypothetical protein